MADKDDHNLNAQDTKHKEDEASLVPEAADKAGENDLGLDLSADPEFLALAAEFDASINSMGEMENSDREPGAILPDSAKPILEASSPYSGEPEGLAELEAAENKGPDFPGTSLDAKGSDAPQIVPGEGAGPVSNRTDPLEFSSLEVAGLNDKSVNAGDQKGEISPLPNADTPYTPQEILDEPADAVLASSTNDEQRAKSEVEYIVLPHSGATPDSADSWGNLANRPAVAEADHAVSPLESSYEESLAADSHETLQETAGDFSNVEAVSDISDSTYEMAEISDVAEFPSDYEKPEGDAASRAEALTTSDNAAILAESAESKQEIAEEETARKKRGFVRSRKADTKKERKKSAEYAQSLPRLGVVSEAEPTLLSRLFNSLALLGLLVLTGVFILQVGPGLQTERLLWFSDELRQADVLSGVFNGNWLQIYLNGQLYQEAPPLYFWFLAGLHKMLTLAGLDLGADYARLLYLGAAVSGLLFLWATFGLARSTARFDRRGAFAAGCVLLSVLFLQFFFHYSSLDLFFAAFIIASQIFMFKALMREYAPLQMGLAFLCAAIALMTKGALGLGLPLLSAILFVCWRGKPMRLFKPDFLLGLFFALLPMMIWLGSIWATGQHEVVIQMLKEQVWVKAFGDASHSEPWWYYLAVLPALWMPWTLLLLVAPWHRLFSRSSWAAFKSARNGERQGLAFVWISLLGAFALISLISSKQPVYLVPLMGPLAVVTGRGVLLLAPTRSMVLQRLMAVVFFALAVFFVLLPVYYSGEIPSFFSWLEHLRLPAWEVKINGIFLLAVVMLAATCLLIGVIKARRPESTLLVMLLCATLFSYPLSTMSMPSIDSVVSSRDASIEIRRYAGLGYYPEAFTVYSGVFSYYSGLIVTETDDWNELEQIISEQPKVIVAMTASRWQDWTLNPGFTEIMRFWMLSNEYVLLLRNVSNDGSSLLDDMQPNGAAEVPVDISLPLGEADSTESVGPAPVESAGPAPADADLGTNSEQSTALEGLDNGQSDSDASPPAGGQEESEVNKAFDGVSPLPSTESSMKPANPADAPNQGGASTSFNEAGTSPVEPSHSVTGQTAPTPQAGGGNRVPESGEQGGAVLEESGAALEELGARMEELGVGMEESGAAVEKREGMQDTRQIQQTGAEPEINIPDENSLTQDNVNGVPSGDQNVQNSEDGLHNDAGEGVTPLPGLTTPNGADSGGLEQLDAAIGQILDEAEQNMALETGAEQLPDGMPMADEPHVYDPFAPVMPE